MDYTTERETVVKDTVLHTTTLAQYLTLSRFPLSMKRLESMKEANDIESIEQDILSFCSQYNLDTGAPLRTLIVRSGGSLLDRDALMEVIQERFPQSLLDSYGTWVKEWLDTYAMHAGPVGSVLEYDLDSLRLIGTIVDETKARLVSTRDTMESEEAYRKHILTQRTRIRSLIGRR